MRYSGVEDFLSSGKDVLKHGPLSLVMVEDVAEVESTIRHNLSLGFQSVLVFAPPEVALPETVEQAVHRVDHDPFAPNALQSTVNRVNDAAPPGLWLYYCFNAEYLFYPFAETRTVGEMLAFHANERRDAMLSYVVDLYAGDLTRSPDAVALDDAWLDKSGYYALARPDPGNHNHPKERQLDFFGGLRWRYEEHVPEARRRIDRISIFRTRPGLRLRSDFTFDDEEYNTYACPWHNNLTAAICSFRTAKALSTNPGSRYDIHGFRWHNSVPFDWTSTQLLELGLMEPGQWF